MAGGDAWLQGDLLRALFLGAGQLGGGDDRGELLERAMLVAAYARLLLLPRPAMPGPEALNCAALTVALCICASLTWSPRLQVEAEMRRLLDAQVHVSHILFFSHHRCLAC